MSACGVEGLARWLLESVFYVKKKPDRVAETVEHVLVD